VAARLPGARAGSIPARTYRHQGGPVRTLKIPVYLACRRDLPAEWAAVVLNGLFDNVVELEMAHPRAIDIRVQTAFPPFEGMYHPGSLQFQDGERDKLLIATGALGGRYYRIGRQIGELLGQAGIPARAIHTDGSLDNAVLLRDADRGALAIMQYDIALAVSTTPRGVYKKDVPWPEVDGEPIHVDGLRCIAALHEERAHIVAVKDVIGSASPTVSQLEGLMICVGPERSGTRVLTQAILGHHGVEPEGMACMPVSDMVDRLKTRHLDAGVFVSGEPSIAIQDLLADDEMCLVSVDATKIGTLTLTAALNLATFDPRAHYRGLLDPDSRVHTISTRALLVTTTDIGFDVEEITRAVYMGAGLLGIEGGEKAMAEPLPSLPSHEDAVGVYRDRGLWPTPEDRTVEILAAGLSILVILVGAWRGSQILLHDRLVDHFRGRVLDVSVAAAELESVRKLKAIRSEVRMRARRRWWHPGRINRRGWQILEQMIEERVLQSMSMLSKEILIEARTLAGREGEEAEAERKALKARIWEAAEQGELNEMQVIVALRALQDE
jgi:TRAP transporter TAXI family solute receptor